MNVMRSRRWPASSRRPADPVGKVRAFLDGLTQENIGSTVEFTAESSSFNEDFAIGPSLATVVNEEWHHRNFAERDLDILITRRTA